MEEFALLSLEFILIIIIAIVSVVAFFQLAELLTEEQLESFDYLTTQGILLFSSPGFDTFMRGVTFFSNREFVWFPAVLLTIYFLFIKPHRWFSIKIPVVALGCASANIILKEFFNRARPLVPDLVHASGLSFPSGHAMFSIAFYGLIIYIVWEQLSDRLTKIILTVLLTALILLIGISRVYLGVHYPSDVVAGFVAGFFWLITSIVIIRYIERRIKSRQRKKAQEH